MNFRSATILLATVSSSHAVPRLFRKSSIIVSSEESLIPKIFSSEIDARACLILERRERGTPAASRSCSSAGVSPVNSLLLNSTACVEINR